MANAVDLTSCDREPIHIPGSIQVHGCMLACTADVARVLRCSENAAEMLGLTGDVVGRPIAELLGGDLVHDVFNALAKSSEPRRPGLLQSVAVGAGTFDIAIHRHAGNVIIEFEPSGAPGSEGPLDIARSLISRTQVLLDSKEFNKRVPRYLQALLGYDRVMLYEFAADGSGKVIG